MQQKAQIERANYTITRELAARECANAAEPVVQAE